MNAQNLRLRKRTPGYSPRRMARPKKEPDRKNIVGVRCSDAELEMLQRAVAKEMEKVTGGTPSLPKYLLAAALEKARKQLGIKWSDNRRSPSRASEVAEMASYRPFWARRSR